MLDIILFCIWRLLERVIGTRPERVIGHQLFRTIALEQRPSITGAYDIPDDKRTMWGELRGDRAGDTMLSSLYSALEVGPYAFDNSMETSIRGINFISKIIAGERRNEADTAVEKKFLTACYYHCLICPDLYVKRTGLSISDQSNNHRFYNLLFLLYYSLFYNKPLKTARIEKFVVARLEEGLFFDEGSSFYHYGVVDSLTEICRLAHEVRREEIFSCDFKAWLTRAGQYQDAFKDLNFGDRDGTLIYKASSEAAPDCKKPVQEFLCNRFYLSAGREELRFVRGENWCRLGTNGHVHDDFGHVIIRNDHARILDPGIHLYREEPSLCERHHHNFPHCNQHKRMSYRAKFERTPTRDVIVEKRGSIVLLTRFGQDIFIERQFNTAEGSFKDLIKNRSNDVAFFEWDFYIEVMPQLASTAIKVTDVVIEINNFGSLVFGEGATVALEQARYFPCYGDEKVCSLIKAKASVNPGHSIAAELDRHCDYAFTGKI